MFDRLNPGVRSVLLFLVLLLQGGLAWGAAQPAPAPAALPVPAGEMPAGANAVGPLSPLGPGDPVTLHVFG